MNKKTGNVKFKCLAVCAGVMALLAAPVKAGAESAAGPDTAEAVILNTEVMKTTKEKVAYLLDEGNKFMKNGGYKDAVKVTEYIINDLDQKDNTEAQDLYAEAKEKFDKKQMDKVNPVKMGF